MSALHPSSGGVLRGKPVIALLSVLVLWIALRVVFWQSPLVLTAQGAQLAEDARPQVQADHVARDARSVGLPQAMTDQPERANPLSRPLSGEWRLPPVERAIDRPQQIPLDTAAGRSGAGDPGKDRAAPVVEAEASLTQRVIGHTLLYAAGLSHMIVPPAFADLLRRQGPLYPDQREPGGAAQGGQGSSLAQAEVRPLFAPALAVMASEAVPDDPARQRRWSADMWAYWRDSAGPGSAAAATGPSYGRSQTGAVMRYHLAPGAGQHPQAYIRASSALEGAREREMAAGLSARPIARVPVRLAVEARVSDRTGGTELRGAAYAVSELAPIALPGGSSAEIYVQAGYVTGDNATGFVDGQARVTRRLASTDTYTLAAGGGAWGGAQKGASRLDIGPTASVTFRLGEEGYGRLSADYRFRVAGDAAPASGPALTLSAGF